MASSFYSKTYSYTLTDTVRFTGSQAKNKEIFKNSNAWRVAEEGDKRGLFVFARVHSAEQSRCQRLRLSPSGSAFMVQPGQHFSC
jgi:hypothetical protein